MSDSLARPAATEPLAAGLLAGKDPSKVNISPVCTQAWCEKTKTVTSRVSCQVLIAPDSDEKTGLKPAELAGLVKAGGGQCVTQRGQFSSLVSAQSKVNASAPADIALFHPESKYKQDRARLRKAGVPCLDPIFLAEWVTCPWMDLTTFFDSGAEIRARLAELMSQRSIGQAAMSQSM